MTQLNSNMKTQRSPNHSSLNEDIISSNGAKRSKGKTICYSFRCLFISVTLSEKLFETFSFEM